MFQRGDGFRVEVSNDVQSPFSIFYIRCAKWSLIIYKWKTILKYHGSRVRGMRMESRRVIGIQNMYCLGTQTQRLISERRPNHRGRVVAWGYEILSLWFRVKWKTSSPFLTELLLLILTNFGLEIIFWEGIHPLHILHKLRLYYLNISSWLMLIIYVDNVRKSRSSQWKIFFLLDTLCSIRFFVDYNFS